jgi:hypothetical protein
MAYEIELEIRQICPKFCEASLGCEKDSYPQRPASAMKTEDYK